MQIDHGIPQVGNDGLTAQEVGNVGDLLGRVDGTDPVGDLVVVLDQVERVGRLRGERTEDGARMKGSRSVLARVGAVDIEIDCRGARGALTSSCIDVERSAACFLHEDDPTHASQR
jgi:hypothetical protein